MQLNQLQRIAPVFTHEGAKAKHITPLQELIRLTMACMLWEDGFYESGKTVADRVKELIHRVSLTEAAGVAIEAREQMKLRHVPLLIVREMARHPRLSPRIVADTLARVIQRPDELTEFLAIYWKDGKCPLSKQVKLGLAQAFAKFNEYQLGKYNRDKTIKLRDVLFLCHSKPTDAPGIWNKQTRAAIVGLPPKSAAIKRVMTQTGHEEGFSPGELLYGKVVYDQLTTPDTWEVELSAGGAKDQVFARLMAENKLGDLAFLRNLRNMMESQVPTQEIINYGDSRRWGRVLPFRFISAARVVPQMEPHLERWMFKCLEGADKLRGKTQLLIDVSGSMADKLSAKSDLTRLDAAKAMAMLLREICEDFHCMIFNTGGSVVAPRRGFALADLIGRPNGGTDIGRAVAWANTQGYDRLIVITDEQSRTQVPSPKTQLSYMINVASNRNGVGYGPWLHIDGFSEAVVDYIQQYEGAE